MGTLRDAGDDLKHARRLFARQPAILLLAIVGLSLGLGIATAAFSVMNVAVLRGEGLVDPNRAPGVLKVTDRSVSTDWTYDEFLRLDEGATRMQVEAVLTETATIDTSGAPQPGAPNPGAPNPGAPYGGGVAFVSGGFFAATGGRVMLGRPLVPADDRHAGPPPVVAGFNLWTTRLNRDPAVIGRTIRIGRTSATIVGVAARGFSVPNHRLIWMPLTAHGAVFSDAPIAPAPRAGIQIFGRLLPGVALSEAEAQLGGVAAGLAFSPSAGETPLRVRLDPGSGLGRAPSSDTLPIAMFVFAVIALVLLLACANVATVLVATAIARGREMGVRAALGASRGRIVRQLVTESVALGTIAAAVGLLLASWALPTIGTLIEAPAGSDLAPDLTVFLFLAVVTLLTGVGAGLAPALHGRGADLVSPLKGADAHQHRLAPKRLRSTLVMTQAAVSVLLIVIATLFMRATFRGAAIDVGFEAGGLYAVSPGRSDVTTAIADVQGVPGVAAVSLIELTPFGGGTRTSISGRGPTEVVTYFNRTGAEYFETVGLRLLAGRTFTRDEVAARAPVGVISQSLARVFFQDRSPLGQMLPAEIAVPALPAPATRPVIIGVVADAIMARLHERNAFAVYEPLGPSDEQSAQLLVRVSGAAGAIDHVTHLLRSRDPQAEVSVTSIAALVQQEASQPRLLATLSGVVGIVAIVLCVIGLYGLTASVVAQRTREMGVRVAMGAAPRDLLRLLMWDSLRPVVLGLAAGIGAAVLIGRVAVAAMFFGVSPQDPIALAVATAILLSAAMLAVLLPTRRAAAVDAASVLRH